MNWQQKIFGNYVGTIPTDNNLYVSITFLML